MEKKKYQRNVLKIVLGGKWSLRTLLLKTVREDFSNDWALAELVCRTELPSELQSVRFNNKTPSDKIDLRLVFYYLCKLCDMSLAKSLNTFLDVRNVLVRRHDSGEPRDCIEDDFIDSRIETLLIVLGHFAGIKTDQHTKLLRNHIESLDDNTRYKAAKSGYEELRIWYVFDPDGLRQSFGCHTGKIHFCFFIPYFIYITLEAYCFT